MLLPALRLTRISFHAMWLAALLAVVALTTGPMILRAIGWQTFVVRGGSMSPAVPLGSMIFVQPISGGQVSAGDVITFTAPNRAIVTHRVLGRTAGSDPTFITQGDANAAPDPNLVPASAVIGRVTFAVPFAGAAMVTLSSAAGMIVAIGLLVSLLVTGWFIDELRRIVSNRSAQGAAAELSG
jgi:signal peptidase